jgi:hypothetical protein
MKKNAPSPPAPPARPKRQGYDFSKGERGKYAARYAAGPVIMPQEPRGLLTQIRRQVAIRLFRLTHRHSDSR